MTNKRWTIAALVIATQIGFATFCQSQALDASKSQTANKILVPSKGWPCGMPEGIPVPESGTAVFEATLELDQVYNLGRTPYGDREVLVIHGGTISGEKIKGSVMTGALDFQLCFPNAVMEVEEVFVLRTSDGKYIYMRAAGTSADGVDVRMVPDFEAPNASDYKWLNEGTYVARRTVDTKAKTLKLSVYKLPDGAVIPKQASSVQVTKPKDFPDQPWDYRKAASGEKRGEQLITENVTLAGSQSVGATKNGGRNIIPITGGTLSGKITGKVLAGGADYQKNRLGLAPLPGANPMTLDARYLWQTSEGDVIIVRNAGPIASLVPVFEVSVTSKYAWLNKGTYLSSSPGMGAGGVSLSFYQSGQ